MVSLKSTAISLKSTAVSLKSTPVSLKSTPVSLNSTLVRLFMVSIMLRVTLEIIKKYHNLPADCHCTVVMSIACHASGKYANASVNPNSTRIHTITIYL